MPNIERRAVLLVGEEIAANEHLFKAVTMINDGPVFCALNTKRALEILNGNPEIRLVLVSQLSYANLPHWIGFVKNLFPSVKVITCSSQSIDSADGWLPNSAIKQNVKRILSSVLLPGFAK